MESGVHDTNYAQNRPVTLSLLCITTFVFGIFKIILFSVATIYLIQPDKDSALTSLLNVLLGIKNPIHTLIWITVTLALIFGARLMWRLRKTGYYMYFFATTIAFFFPAFIAGAEMMTIQRLVFTSMFIFFYGIHLRFMK